MTKEEFAQLTEGKFTLLDGALGSNLYLAGMPHGVSTEGWILEHPHVVEKLQREYVQAGSEIIYAPTFGCNRHTLQGFGLDSQMEEMNERLVELARRASDGRAYVAGDMAPTGMILEQFGGKDTTDELFTVYEEQAKLLDRAGVDLFVVETMMSLEETEVALDAISSVSEKPVMCTLSYQADGMTMYGTNCVDAVDALQEMGASAVGLNCSVGPDQLEAVVRSMKKIARVPVIAKPNAGLPAIDEMGVAHYSMGPEEFARYTKALADAGAAILGGCCGTDPEYIRKLKFALEGKLLR